MVYHRARLLVTTEVIFRWPQTGCDVIKAASLNRLTTSFACPTNNKRAAASHSPSSHVSSSDVAAPVHSSMKGIRQNFDNPDETRPFEKGHAEIVEINGVTLMRARLSSQDGHGLNA